MKTCIKCDGQKPVTEFYPHKSMTSGRLNKCRSCTKEENIAWRSIPTNRARWNEGRHAKNLEKQFGITRTQFDAMYANPVCEGCGVAKSRQGKRLAVDHCHKTGKVRGLLCHECNRTISTAQDDPAILRSLALYLEAKS
jgi:hypothetical protein